MPTFHQLWLVAILDDQVHHTFFGIEIEDKDIKEKYGGDKQL